MTCYKPGRSKTLFFGLNPKGAKFLEALNLWVRCRRRFFFPQKRGPIFLEALNLWVRCRRRLFFPEKWPPYVGSPELVGTLPQALFFPQKRLHISGSQIWARIMRARHGNIWHGTDHEGTARKSAASLQGGTGVFLTRHGNIGICGICGI